MADDQNGELKMAIEQFVRENKLPDMILTYIKIDFNLKWSKRTLRRYCFQNNIKRYDTNLRPEDVMDAIRDEAKGCAKKLGYRMLWQRLRRKGLLVKRDQVEVCLRLLGQQNPVPVKKRKHQHCYISKGPNSVWHVDGNDKMMRWGFYVHGAIDGYSRKILWLNVFVTNKDPWLIGKFFMATVETYGFCPLRVQCDPGTENPILSKCQMFLRRNHTDSLAGPKSYFEGSSVTNQPIESFWRHFREEGIQFWIDHFKQLESDGDWNPGNCLHQLCILYVYMPLLEAEVLNMVKDWNGHKIRLQKRTDRPNGIPNELFDFPEPTGGEEMSVRVCEVDVIFIKQKYSFQQPLQYLPVTFMQEADQFMERHGLFIETESAREIYLDLVRYFETRDIH